jgi:hypothetical protein
LCDQSAKHPQCHPYPILSAWLLPGNRLVENHFGVGAGEQLDVVSMRPMASAQPCMSSASKSLDRKNARNSTNSCLNSLDRIGGVPATATIRCGGAAAGAVHCYHSAAAAVRCCHGGVAVGVSGGRRRVGRGRLEDLLLLLHLWCILH